MIVLGLLLIAVAAAFGIELFVSNNHTETVGEVFGQSITHLSAAGYYLLGSATTVALLFGALLVDSGLRRARKHKVERDEREAQEAEAARQMQWEKAAAVSEADRLRDELVEERMNQATLGGVVMPPDVEAPGEVVTAPAEPVDDPEHAESDHRGVLGRIRGDREELPEPPAAPPAQTATPAAKAPRAAKATALPASAPAPTAKPGAAKPARASAAKSPPTPAPATPTARPLTRTGVTPQGGVEAGPVESGPVERTELGTPIPRPESAADAFNAAVAPSADREEPTAP